MRAGQLTYGLRYLKGAKANGAFLTSVMWRAPAATVTAALGLTGLALAAAVRRRWQRVQRLLDLAECIAQIVLRG